MRALVFAALVAAASVAHADSVTVTTTTTVTIDVPIAPPSDTPPRTPVAVPAFRASVAFGPALGFDTKDKCAGGECIGLHAQIGGELRRGLPLQVGRLALPVQ